MIATPSLVEKSGDHRRGANGAGDPVWNSSAIEQDSIGALLKFEEAWAEAMAIGLTETDFEAPYFRRIYRAITELAIEQKARTVPAVADHLDGTGHHLKDGWLAFLGPLVRETLLEPDRIGKQLRALKSRSIMRRVGARDDTDLGRMRREMAALEALEAKPATTESAVTPIDVLWYATLNGAAHQDHLVKGLLIACTLSVVFGESNSGKTFWVLDLALTVAAGLSWRGRRTKRGLVVYVAGEGAASVRARVAAYRQGHPNIGSLPFCIVPQAVDFLDGDSIATLIATLRAAEATSGEKVVWIIIDTFARAIPGGNENDAQDVGMAVAAADRIRGEVGTAVTFVHHAGKDPAKGARGSSALRAATDTEILIEGQTGPRTATVTKQRDLVSGERFGFTLRAVNLGTDLDGDSLTSCVVEQAEEQRAPSRKIQGKNQSALLAALQERHRIHPEKLGLVSTIELREITKTQGMNRGRAKEAVEGLVGYGWLTPAAGGYRFLSEEPSP